MSGIEALLEQPKAARRPKAKDRPGATGVNLAEANDPTWPTRNPANYFE